ncbi:MAG: bile acid:sodium symporter family protein, partial [Gammaproteobacteria bacterium]
MIRTWQKTCNQLTGWFPLWLLIGGLWAWRQPDAWIWFQTYISIGLGVIMLGMGLTLRLSDFAEVLRMPKIVSLGLLAQFIVMPLSAFFWARVFHLDAALATGLILVGCCPGGTASNVICYLARANVALSVLLTLCSTLTAVVITPLLTQWLAGAYLPVDAWGLFNSLVVVVLIPMIAGLLVNT